MDADRWQRLSPLLDALFELGPDERAQRMRVLREEDGALADELAALIALDQGHADFLSEPVMPPMAALRAGSEVGPYRLDHQLGEGGMGQVWMAMRADGLYQRRVALKLLRPGLADPNLRLRFTRERQILARLAHPHIARLLDAGISSDQLPYLALEYVEGEPITDYCQHHRTPQDARLRMFRQICDAVSHAHANLIVHRDLKPSNILVTPGGDVRLLDFGIAKLLDGDAPMVERTRTGVRAFTLHYAAPEQIRGEPVTTMTDVYSLGVILYELLTDTKPYRMKRDSDAAWEEAILSVDPVRPSQSVLRRAEGGGSNHNGRAAGADSGADADVEVDVHALRRHARHLSGDLDNIVLKALAKRPEQRYASVEALAQDLLRHEGGRPVQARPQSVGYRAQKYLRRHRWSLAMGLLVATVLSLALGIVAWQARQAVDEASRAQAMQDFMVDLFENAGNGPDGRSLDLRGLLDAAVERGSRELSRQPRARAELLGVIARLRTGLGDYREAAALLDRQAAIIASTPGMPTSLQLESLTQRGEVLQRSGQVRACTALMQPALDHARREQSQLPTQASAFYSQLGRCRRGHGERQSARLLFERALALRRGVVGAEIGEIENRLDLAGLHADSGQTAQALEEYEAARTELRQLAGDRHPLLIEIDRSLAALHRTLGRPATAERELRQALAIALETSGPQHPATLAVRGDLASVLVERGHYAGAEQELLARHRGLVTRLGAAHSDLRGSHAALGRIAWERGEVSAALTALGNALAISRRGGDPTRIGESQFALAEVLLGSGRATEALPLLEQARDLLTQRRGPGHALVGDIERLLGEAAAAMGRPEAAQRHFETAVRLTRDGYGETHPQSRQAELALARHQAIGGDGAALTRLYELAALPGRGDSRLRAVAWRARAAAAQVRCNGPERESARRSLDTLIGTLHKEQPDGGAIVRETVAIRASCGQVALDQPARTSRAGGRANRSIPTFETHRRKGLQRQRLLQRRGHAFAAHHLLVFGARHRQVALVATDLDLRPVLHGEPLRVHTHRHRRLLAAVADGLDLGQFVGPREQVLAALEQLPLEIRAQPVAQHRDAKAVDHLAQLPHLRFAQELRLVDQHAMQRPVRGDIGTDQRFEVLVAFERNALRA